MTKSSSATELKSVTTSKSSSDDTILTIQNRRSQELIIGLCGAVGSGIKALKGTLITALELHGYKVFHVRLSDIIGDKLGIDVQSLDGYERYKKLQDGGDKLRKTYGNTILADLGIERIGILRGEHFGNEDTTGRTIKTEKKVAYVIDQIKHQDEAILFRTVYRNNFYLLGLIRTEKERRLNLEDEKISSNNIDDLIRRDRKDSNSNGQQVEKALYGSDFFIRNTHNQSQFMKSSVERFINLVHGVNGVTPTNDEVGMFAAYSASLSSACLSRQVGAAISDEHGRVLSTGCNDVPEFNGGLYNANSKSDFRCVNKGRCHNDKHKEILQKEIGELLRSEHSINPVMADNISKSILSKTKANALIEYSRAIHAEMDAIISLARCVSESTVNKTLYSTTYPCHNCARHIVAAGIIKVIYIEPYEKSLALKLHDDSITDSDEKSKVYFQPFEGVSPERFQKFFRANGKRKDTTGRAVVNKVLDSFHVDSQYLDSYHDYEKKIALRLAYKFKDESIIL